jgi:type III restriction enzyme
MTDDTRNCDDVAEYLEKTFPELKNAVLVIHTNNNGDIKEDTKGKSDEELKELRQQANKIDSFDSKYKAVVSVLMLKEGWDVKNVTTIVGLRAYSSNSKILPEQTLGRGLRRMFPRSDIIEQVSVVGTQAFMDFVQSIKREGVELERAAMGSGTQAKTPVVVEVEEDNPKKNMEELDIEIPILTPRIYREYKNFSEIDISKFSNPVKEKTFTEAEQREIVFKDIATDEISHTTMLKAVNNPDSNSMIAFFVNNIKKDLRLIGGQEILHGKVKDFMQNYLFGKTVAFDNLNIMRNISEPEVNKTIYNFFKTEINNLTIKDKGEAVIDGNIKLRKTRPFSANQQAFYQPKKSVFNKIIGDSHFELEFASFLDGCNDIVSFAKNYFGVNFKLDYVNKSGDISNYYPDFIVKKSDKEVYIVETKGMEDLDTPLKIARLKEWCKDINKLQSKVKYDFVFVEYNEFQTIKFVSLEQLVSYFTKYKD